MWGSNSLGQVRIPSNNNSMSLPPERVYPTLTYNGRRRGPGYDLEEVGGAGSGQLETNGELDSTSVHSTDPVVHVWRGLSRAIRVNGRKPQSVSPA